MNRSPSTTTATPIKLVIAAPPGVDLANYLKNLASLWPQTVLRDYQLGALDVMRLETQRTLAGSATSVSVSLHALLNQSHYAAIQEVLLSNADGILLMLDMAPDQHNETIHTVLQTTQSLRRQGLDIHQIPLVLQYHRAELASPETIAEWDRLLEWERNEIPRYLSHTNFHTNSTYAIEALLQRALEIPQHPVEAH